MINPSGVRMTQKSILFLLRMYRKLVSPFLGANCRFFPSCSHYMEEAVSKKGAAVGARLGLQRMIKCHPFHPGGFDPLEQ